MAQQQPTMDYQHDQAVQQQQQQAEAEAAQEAEQQKQESKKPTKRKANGEQKDGISQKT